MSFELRPHQTKDALILFLEREGEFRCGERWEHVLGFPRYMVSDCGRVFSAVRACRILSPSKTPQGYPYVSLMLDGKAHKLTIHKLVAVAFVQNPDGMPIVNHIDGNKSNSHYLNLEWCTYADNNNHARDNRLVKNFGEDHYAAKLTDADIKEIRGLLADGIYHKDIAAKFGVNRQQITKIANGQAWRRV